MRLAMLKIVEEIVTYEGEDFIQVKLDNGICHTKKGSVSKGGMGIYIEKGAVLPLGKQYDFLKKSCYYQDKQGNEGILLETGRFFELNFIPEIRSIVLAKYSAYPERNHDLSNFFENELQHLDFTALLDIKHINAGSGNIEQISVEEAITLKNEKEENKRYVVLIDPGKNIIAYSCLSPETLKVLVPKQGKLTKKAEKLNQILIENSIAGLEKANEYLAELKLEPLHYFTKEEAIELSNKLFIDQKAMRGLILGYLDPDFVQDYEILTSEESY